MLVSGLGDIKEINLDGSEPLVDSDHIVCWEDTLKYEYLVAEFGTGEDFVGHFSGHGKVYVQSRSMRSLAEALTPFFPVRK